MIMVTSSPANVHFVPDEDAGHHTRGGYAPRPSFFWSLHHAWRPFLDGISDREAMPAKLLEMSDTMTL
jgi:hypothetical protein